MSLTILRLLASVGLAQARPNYQGGQPQKAKNINILLKII